MFSVPALSSFWGDQKSVALALAVEAGSQNGDSHATLENETPNKLEFSGKL
jgi:hypothetical protein